MYIYIHIHTHTKQDKICLTYCKKKKLFPELKNHLDSSDSEYWDGCAYDAPRRPEKAPSSLAGPTCSHSGVCVKVTAFQKLMHQSEAKTQRHGLNSFFKGDDCTR